jgi:hypothetical protein
MKRFNCCLFVSLLLATCFLHAKNNIGDAIYELFGGDIEKDIQRSIDIINKQRQHFRQNHILKHALHNIGNKPTYPTISECLDDLQMPNKAHRQKLYASVRQSFSPNESNVLGACYVLTIFAAGLGIGALMGIQNKVPPTTWNILQGFGETALTGYAFGSLFEGTKNYLENEIRLTVDEMTSLLKSCKKHPEICRAKFNQKDLQLHKHFEEKPFWQEVGQKLDELRQK